MLHVTKHELGQCGPLNLVINATLTATCDKIVLPWVCIIITYNLHFIIAFIIASVRHNTKVYIN